MRPEDNARIEQAMWYMEAHCREQPSLEAIAADVNLSKYHFHRLFTRGVGISPGRFLHCLRLQHAKQALAGKRSLLDAALDAGLSGPGRLHDLFVTYEAMTPGEYKRGGAGLALHYGFHATPFGECLVAVTERGLCGLAFVGPRSREEELAVLQQRWPGARLLPAPERTEPLAGRVFGTAAPERPLHLVLQGTNFQVKVWEALLRIPSGGVATYADIARHVGSPRAVRAVGQAAGRNPLAYLIPCHRVIRKMGLVGDYRWGNARKRLLLAWEAARHDAGSELDAAVGGA